MNIGNLCVFEGRITKDIEVSTLGSGDKTFTKVKFSIAVDKNMTKAQKDAAKQSNKPTADFIPLEAIGGVADFISKWFGKGKAIRVVASFKNNNYTDKNGNQVYSYAFDVSDASFTIADSQGASGGAGNNNQAPKVNNSFDTVNDDDIPF